MSTISKDPVLTRDGNAFTFVPPVLFGSTVLISACLLFLVQPLSSKLILPWFGGSAAVWITCMLFFQTALLLGYAYAHSLTRIARLAGQVAIHAALLLASLAALPILPSTRWLPRPGADPTWPLLGALATSVGLPYLLLSSTTPLIQFWYARTSAGALPYRYFALSNAGSLLALLAFPLLVEPTFTGHQQAWGWSVSFVLFAALCIGTGSWIFRRERTLHSLKLARSGALGRTRPADLLTWIGLAACASALLLTTTSLLTENIAPMPLLWVLPLSIYLLTFIFCFEGSRWYKRIVFLPLVLPALGCLMAAAGPLNNASVTLAVPLLCASLFVCCMACHGELAKVKPESARLTSFYLSLAFGGALGGLFVGLLAPHFFSAHYEYPLTFLGCAALLLFVLWRGRSSWNDPVLQLRLWQIAGGGAIVLAGFAFAETWRTVGSARLLARNFYGALRVQDEVDRKRIVRVLNHGSITHGVQFLRPELSHLATTYYARDSGVGLAWRTLETAGPIRMGVVGLGAGTLAAYGRAGDTLRFYEINPLIVQIAQNQFTYLSDCPAHVDLVLGDARLSLAAEPSQKLDLLVVDAFSGDAIPVHLLTREAFRIYWRHLKPDGVLVLHISNRYLTLGPVIKLAAEESGTQAWEVDSDDNEVQEIYGASYVLVTNRPGFFTSALLKGRLSNVTVPPGMRPWTDDYSNLWQVLSPGPD